MLCGICRGSRGGFSPLKSSLGHILVLMLDFLLGTTDGFCLGSIKPACCGIFQTDEEIFSASHETNVKEVPGCHYDVFAETKYDLTIGNAKNVMTILMSREHPVCAHKKEPSGEA